MCNVIITTQHTNHDRQNGFKFQSQETECFQISETEKINLMHILYNDNSMVHSLIRRGFNNTIVDRSNRATYDILCRCKYPRIAGKFVLVQSCDDQY